VEGDPLFIGLMDMTWCSVSIPVIEQQVEKSVPYIVIPVCTVTMFVLYLCVTSEEPFTMLIMTL